MGETMINVFCCEFNSFTIQRIHDNPMNCLEFFIRICFSTQPILVGDHNQFKIQLPGNFSQPLKNAGIKIPDDLLLIGFTNTNMAELINPPLSAVRQPAFEMGQVATELLIQIIESKRPITDFETRMLDTELFTRNSSQK